MKKLKYRNRKHVRSPLTSDAAQVLRGWKEVAEEVAHQIRESADDFLSPPDAESDWRNLPPKKSPEAE